MTEKKRDAANLNKNKSQPMTDRSATNISISGPLTASQLDNKTFIKVLYGGKLFRFVI
jgi:hypothetical protein